MWKYFDIADKTPTTKFITNNGSQPLNIIENNLSNALI